MWTSVMSSSLVCSIWASTEQRRVSMELPTCTPSLKYDEQLPYFSHKTFKNWIPPCGTRKISKSAFTSSKVQKCSAWRELNDVRSNSRKKASISARTEDPNVADLATDSNPGWPLMADSTAAVWSLLSSSATVSLPLPAAEKWEKRGKIQLSKHNYAKVKAEKVNKWVKCLLAPLY